MNSKEVSSISAQIPTNCGTRQKSLYTAKPQPQKMRPRTPKQRGTNSPRRAFKGTLSSAAEAEHTGSPHIGCRRYKATDANSPLRSHGGGHRTIVNESRYSMIGSTARAEANQFKRNTIHLGAIPDQRQNKTERIQKKR